MNEEKYYTFFFVIYIFCIFLLLLRLFVLFLFKIKIKNSLNQFIPNLDTSNLLKIEAGFGLINGIYSDDIFEGVYRIINSNIIILSGREGHKRFTVHGKCFMYKEDLFIVGFKVYKRTNKNIKTQYILYKFVKKNELYVCMNGNTITLYFLCWTTHKTKSIIIPSKINHKLYKMSINNTCSICRVNNKDDSFICPCGHYGFCSECYYKIRICPFCRKSF